MTALWMIVLCGVLSIVYAIWATASVLKADAGNPRMQEIAAAVREGAQAYLRRQYTTIGIVGIVIFALLAYFLGMLVAFGFAIGAILSGAAGFIGMNVSVRANVRTAQAATTSLAGGLELAFKAGAITGMLVAGLALLGVTIYFAYLTQYLGLAANSRTVIDAMVALGFGASLISIFARLGGGIFTKGADVGGDLVGKVEAGIPEDDPRNPATIADNVGDNVGDCAGMAADLFESYEVTLVASIILGVAAFSSIYPEDKSKWVLGLIFPLIARAVGVLASIVGIFAVRARAGETNALKAINRGFLTAGILTVIGTGAVALGYVGNDEGRSGTKVLMTNPGWRVFAAGGIGLVLAQALSRLTEYFTSTETAPVHEIAEATRTGPATTVLSGISSGLESSVYAIILIAIALGSAIALGDNNLQFSLYLVALTGMGMLATTGVVVSEDTFGPVSDNAAGIAEMSGEFEGEAERIMVSLDAVGNTTKAVTKGFAIGSAVIAAVALFASFIETIGSELDLRNASGAAKGGTELFRDAATQINVADPKVFIGLLIGGAVPFLFPALAIRAVGRTAGVVVQEVRRQFADGKIMSGERQPEYGPVIDICTTASLRELATPALLAVLTPVIIGFGINYLALGAFIAAVILTGQLMANFLSNSGGAWDNAKKYIEDGHEGGKGSEAHKAAVIGDTVGDPFKDTAGPALNPLIKVMNLVSLLLLPAIISLKDNDAARFTIAGAAVVVLVIAIAFSKRKTESMDAGVAAGTFAAVGHDAPPEAAGREPKVEAALAHGGGSGRTD